MALICGRKELSSIHRFEDLAFLTVLRVVLTDGIRAHLARLEACAYSAPLESKLFRRESNNRNSSRNLRVCAAWPPSNARERP